MNTEPRRRLGRHGLTSAGVTFAGSASQSNSLARQAKLGQPASPEAFDQTRGRLFVIRLAGNFVDDDGLASVEYGATVLGAFLIMVLGHNVLQKIALQLRNNPKKVRVFANRLRLKICKAKSSYEVNDHHWEWYAILTLWPPLEVIRLLEDSSESPKDLACRIHRRQEEAFH
jgi:hypothetical protein